MAMMTCTYCNMEISMSSVEAEDGYCPECGAVITSSSIFTDNSNEDDIEDGDDDDLDEMDFDEEEDEVEIEDEIEELDFDDEELDGEDDK